jgi:hypothetical protein
MNHTESIGKLKSILPDVRKWIDDKLEEYSADAKPVIELPFQCLKTVYPLELLERAKVVVIEKELPFPLLKGIDLPELTKMKKKGLHGVTYKDTFFIDKRHGSEILHFHELVHVVQWDLLKIDNFLLAYGIGLMQFEYKKSPLEKMAYSLQDDFKDGLLHMDTVDIIRRKTSEIWNEVSELLSS